MLAYMTETPRENTLEAVKVSAITSGRVIYWQDNGTNTVRPVDRPVKITVKVVEI